LAGGLSIAEPPEKPRKVFFFLIEIYLA